MDARSTTWISSTTKWDLDTSLKPPRKKRSTTQMNLSSVLRLLQLKKKPPPSAPSGGSAHSKDFTNRSHKASIKVTGFAFEGYENIALGVGMARSFLTIRKQTRKPSQTRVFSMRGDETGRVNFCLPSFLPTEKELGTGKGACG